MDKFFRTISMIFSPLLMPTYAIILVMTLSFLRFSPTKARVIVSIVTFVVTCVLPIIAIYLLTRLKMVDDPMLHKREQRPVPYIIAACCYIGMGIYLTRVGAPIWVPMFMYGGTLALVINIVVNHWWKISGHMAGLGGLTALIFAMTYYGYSVDNLQWGVVAIVLIDGLVGTARVILGRHTLGQVVAGFANGLGCVLLFSVLATL